MLLMLLLVEWLLHGGGSLLYLLVKWPYLLFVFERLVKPLQLFTVQPPQLCIALLLALDFSCCLAIRVCRSFLSAITCSNSSWVGTSDGSDVSSRPSDFRCDSLLVSLPINSRKSSSMLQSVSCHSPMTSWMLLGCRPLSVRELAADHLTRSSYGTFIGSQYLPLTLASDLQCFCRSSTGEPVLPWCGISGISKCSIPFAIHKLDHTPPQASSRNRLT